MDFDFDDNFDDFEDGCDFEPDDEFDDGFELEDNLSSDQDFESEDTPHEENFDVEDAMFWGGFFWTMADGEREDKPRKKKKKTSIHDEEEKKLKE